MTCEELVEFLSRYVEKDLPPEQDLQMQVQQMLGEAP